MGRGLGHPKLYHRNRSCNATETKNEWEERERRRELTCIDFIHGPAHGFIWYDVNYQSLLDAVSINPHHLTYKTRTSFRPLDNAVPSLT